jgi:hypothetical protein
VRVIGDGFMVTFRTAAQALTFRMEEQNVLLGAPWPEEILETPYSKGLHDKGGKAFFVALSCDCSSIGPLQSRRCPTAPSLWTILSQCLPCSSIHLKSGKGHIAVTREFMVETRKCFNHGDTRAYDVGGIGSSQGSQNPTRRWIRITDSDLSLQLL